LRWPIAAIKKLKYASYVSKLDEHAAPVSEALAVPCLGWMVECPRMSNNETTARRRKLVFILILGVTTGVVGDLLAAAILFRRDSFFESVVVCLLVIILCSVATMRVDFGPGGFLQLSDDTKENSLQQVSASLKALFYGIAMIMAIVKIVLALIDSL